MSSTAAIAVAVPRFKQAPNRKPLRRLTSWRRNLRRSLFKIYGNGRKHKQ